jgi:hypothetical protein
VLSSRIEKLVVWGGRLRLPTAVAGLPGARRDEVRGATASAYAIADGSSVTSWERLLPFVDDESVNAIGRRARPVVCPERE